MSRHVADVIGFDFFADVNHYPRRGGGGDNVIGLRSTAFKSCTTQMSAIPPTIILLDFQIPVHLPSLRTIYLNLRPMRHELFFLHTELVRHCPSGQIVRQSDAFRRATQAVISTTEFDLQSYARRSVEFSQLTTRNRIYRAAWNADAVLR